MTWAPQKQVLDVTTIVDNLLRFIEDTDADALLWANGGTPLAEFAKTYPNAAGRLQTIFPSVMVLTQELETDLTGDALLGGLQLVLETSISGSDADELTSTGKVYAKAMESMLSNIPTATIAANASPAIGNVLLFELETRFDILRGATNSASSWLQIFQTRVLYSVSAPAF